MKKLLKKMGWINYRGKLDYSEITIDILILCLIGLTVYAYKIMV